MDSFESIAEKLQALDNKTKLEILNLLVNEGAKSITDIAKSLRINFSTAHKYLEQLEKADLVESRMMLKNRMKRLFFVKDFAIDLSPGGLSKGVSQAKNKTTQEFMFIDNNGVKKEFNADEFIKASLESGLPRSTIDTGIEHLKNQAYTGITAVEINKIFKKFLVDRISKLTDSLQIMRFSNLKAKTFFDTLSTSNYELLEKHMEGTIFISNLGQPKLMNVVHDLHGLSLHGLDKKVAKNLSQLFSQTETVINSISNHVYPVHTFDSFNYIFPVSTIGFGIYAPVI